MADLATSRCRWWSDIGSGLLAPHPRLPDEPDATTYLRQGAALVTASGDKLLGGPQCGCCSATPTWCSGCGAHPFARALRVDKLTLAALEATLTRPPPPVVAACRAPWTDGTAPVGLPPRWAPTSPRPWSEAAVGGGGAPGVVLPSAAVAVPRGSPRRCASGSCRLSGGSSRGGCCSTWSRSADRDDELTEAVRRAAETSGPDVHVVATAGHVDHGKSTLVRGARRQEPDRLADEQRRGLSIELGYCWTRARPTWVTWRSSTCPATSGS